jgi:hypothetical protein
VVSIEALGTGVGRCHPCRELGKSTARPSFGSGHRGVRFDRGACSREQRVA